MSNLPFDSFEKDNLRIGETAPDFVLDTEVGEKWRLSDQRGKVTALLFYPQNETLVCTRQMCSVRDHWLEYLDTKATVVGISPGSIEQNDIFAKRYRLPLPILADNNREITKIYGQHWLFPVQLTRTIVVIDARGLIRCRNTMLRMFRPTDRSILANIYAARTDILQARMNKILAEAKESRFL